MQLFRNFFETHSLTFLLKTRRLREDVCPFFFIRKRQENSIKRGNTALPFQSFSLWRERWNGNDGPPLLKRQNGNHFLKINRFLTLAHQRDNVFEFFKNKLPLRSDQIRCFGVLDMLTLAEISTFLSKSICIFCQFIWTSRCNKLALTVRPQICYGPRAPHWNVWRMGVSKNRQI